MVIIATASGHYKEVLVMIVVVICLKDITFELSILLPKSFFSSEMLSSYIQFKNVTLRFCLIYSHPNTKHLTFLFFNSLFVAIRIRFTLSLPKSQNAKTNNQETSIFMQITGATTQSN